MSLEQVLITVSTLFYAVVAPPAYFWHFSISDPPNLVEVQVVICCIQ